MHLLIVVIRIGIQKVVRSLLLRRLLASVLGLLPRPDLLSDTLANVDTALVRASSAISDLSVEQVRVLVIVKIVLREGKPT